jgi:hypothetical protein
MTTPSVPSSPGSAVGALRTLFAWALLGYVALQLFFEFFLWIVPARGTSLAARSFSAGFVGLYTIALPLLAVLIASQISPMLTQAKLMAAIAVLEYLAAVLFGALAYLLGIIQAFDYVDGARGALMALRYLVMDAAELAIAALAGYAVLRVFLALGGTLPEFGARPKSPAEPPTQQL